MATLIAANYQSTTVTSYGGMLISCGTLKANTLYTLKCRYKYTKNTSSMPQILCYNSNWSHTGGIYDATDDGVMKTRIITFTSYPSAINYKIGCYAWSYNDQYNGGGKTGVLEVDWYELWEGDATTFSLTDAIALSGYSGVNDFLTIQGTTDKPLRNPGYFSTSELKNALRSWIGYYYKTHSTTSYGDWTYTYNHYSSASRSRTVTTYDHYSNGKVVQVSRITQTEDATVTYSNWSYNWVTTGNSSRSCTVTYTWSDYAPQFTQTETNGGTRYLVLSEETYDGAGGKIVYSFPANGSGSKSLTVYAHDYWGSACISTSTKISDVSVTCTGFTPTVSGSTITITASNLGTTPTDYKRSTITVSKSGFQTRSGCTSVEQEANTITSYGTPQMKGIKWSSLVPAGGGTATPSITSYNQVANWTSGSKSNITSGASISFTRAQIVQDVDPEFYNSPNNMNIYDNAGSGKTTLTRVTSGYPSGIPNNSGVAYRIQNTGAGPSPNLGGFYHNYGGTSGQTYIWTFDAYVPTGYELQHNHNSLGSGGSYTWRTPTVGANEWRTYSVEVYFGTSNSTAFFCSLIGTAGTSSKPVTWWIANSKICKISNVSASKPTINTTTGAVTLESRGTTTGGIGVVDTYGAVLGTITMNGKTGKFVAAPSQQANAVTKIEAAVANKDTSSCHWYVSPGTSSNKIAAAGGTGTVTGNGTCKFTFTSGSTENKGSSGDYKGNTLSFSRTYKISGTTATTSNGFTLNTSTGAVTADNNATSSDRTVNITSGLTVTWGSFSNTLTQSRDVYQAAGTRTYQIVLNPSSITWAASGGSQSVTVQYNTLWNGIKTAGPTALSGYTVGSLSNCTSSGTSGTTTISVGQNTSSSARNVSATFSKSGYSSATLTGTQNKPVTSTSTIYRVSYLSTSTKTLLNTSGTDYIYVYMDKATVTYYKDTSSGSAFKTTTGSWSAVTGKEAAASGISFYIYFQSINNSDTSWIRTGTPTLSLVNGTSTAAAYWKANFAYDANIGAERQVKMLIVHDTANDVQGAGKNYCTVTQFAGASEIPISFWGANVNPTDIYTSFSMGTIRINANGADSEAVVRNVACGGSVRGYGSYTSFYPIGGTTWDVEVDSILNCTINSIHVAFDYARIDNALDMTRYRNCVMWVEVGEGGSGNYGWGAYTPGMTWKSESWTISTNYLPLDGQRIDYTFTFYDNNVLITSNTEIRICMGFSDS